MDIRDAVTKEIARLQKVLALLNDDRATAVPISRSNRGHSMSKAARAKIAAAQRARWAKLKGKR